MRIARRYQLLLLGFIVLSTYYSALFAPLCFIDDNNLVFYAAADMGLRDLIPVIFSGSGYYRPLLIMTYVFDNYLWLLSESFLHLENVLLHLANATLLFGIAERLAKRKGLPENSGVPFWVALLFALHPLATESVNWISGRTDPLACLFLLLSLKFLLDWFASPPVQRTLLIQISFLLACLSKETAVFFIGPAIVLSVLMRSSDGDGAGNLKLSNLIFFLRRDMSLYISFVATALFYFAMRYFASITTVGKDGGLNKVSSYLSRETADSLWFDKILEFFKTTGFYSKKMLAPWPLNFNIIHVSDWYAVVGIVILILLTMFIWKRRDLIAGLFFSAVLVASSALLVSISKLAWTLYAERYLYIALIFFIPASVLWLYEKIGTLRDGQPFRVIMLLVFGASLITTVQRNLVWMDRDAFCENNYKNAPSFHTAIRFYEASLRMQGREQEAKELMKQLPKKTKVAKGSVVK